jgi:lysophospholipid acyltransferase (LPLAT)-like uncharacterized protein
MRSASENSSHLHANAQSSGVVRPHAPRFSQQFAAWFVWALVRLIGLTIRFTIRDRSGYFDGFASGHVIFCIWHNRLALSIPGYHKYLRKRHTSAGLAALVSASKDGAFVTSILQRFAVQPVRGSSSRRGSQALLELVTWAERGYNLAITPDGPRGPCYQVQDGILSLAQLTGLPIIPISFNIQWKVRPNSWDRFQIPLPFSCCEAVLEKPILVPRDASDVEREELRQRLEKALRDITVD